MATNQKTKENFGQVLAGGILKLLGWKVMGDFPEIPKYVIIGAPHTSNWDFPITMLWMFAAGVRFNWIGKESLFKRPLGGIFYRLGGIPVKRDSSHNFVDQIVAAFGRSEHMIVAITPEGTRSKSPYWKSGFYYMAVGAGVPLLLGFIDFGRKEIGIGPMLEPCGDIQADFAVIREFYSQKRGLHPQKQGAIELKPGTGSQTVVN